MRIEPSRSDEAPDAITQAVLDRRGGRLLMLDRMLLRSPPFALGWNSFIGAVRTELNLPPRLRELAMCAVAVLNGADYEFQQHSPHYLAAGGASETLSALAASPGEAVDLPSLTASERAALKLTIAMTTQIKVSDVIFAEVKAALPDEREVVELVGVIAAYNMVSRFLVALDVTHEPGGGPAAAP